MRRCYNCSIILLSEYYYELNKELYSKEYLRSIWNNKNIELLCCECYDNMILLNVCDKCYCEK